jgi:hypothetical protein
MNNRFDELTKALAQSATRRQALKKFGVGLAGMVLACFGVANKAEAGHNGCLQPCIRRCLKGGWTLSGCQSFCGLECFSGP